MRSLAIPVCALLLALSSLLVAGPLPEVLPEADPSVRRSVFPLDTGASCFRWCGHPTAVTADLVLTALQLAGGWTGGIGSSPWLVASGSLSPNHWFTTAGAVASGDAAGSDVTTRDSTRE